LAGGGQLADDFGIARRSLDVSGDPVARALGVDVRKYPLLPEISEPPRRLSQGVWNTLNWNKAGENFRKAVG
jgi:hypothetical protein